MRVELVGGMASGKSTLAERLEFFGAFWVQEFLTDNPFLEDCYEDFETFRFPSQMWFALTKYREIGLYEDPHVIYVHDQAVINNNAYTNLLYKDAPDDPSRVLVQQTFDYTTERFGQPDAVINLLCDPEVQLERIKSRGREYEQDLDLDFLVNLDTEVERLLQESEQEIPTVINVSSDSVDFKTDDDFVEQLLETLENIKEKKYESSTRRHRKMEGTA